MQVSKIEQHYCQTSRGRVCYWLSSSLGQSGAEVNPAQIQLFLFLHGLGGSGRYWFAYLEELAQDSRPVLALAPDLLGFGASDKPDIEYTPEVQLGVIEAELEDCLSRFQPAKTATIELQLVGHSMGGILALLLLARLVSDETTLKAYALHLAGLGLLGTPNASPKHDLEREVLHSPMNRAMLSHPLICQTVHHSLKLLWPLVLFLIRKGWLKPGLPLPIVADYMQHTCRSYTSSAHHLIFEVNLEPALKSLPAEITNSLPTLLVYSRADKEFPWQHGRELAAWFSSSRLELLEQAGHQQLGQAGLNLVLKFLL
jgi:pimeloyl-ACP methyl ester carboxylesterase